MKTVHGWFLPENDTHFSAYLEGRVQQGKMPEYQEEHRERAISYCTELRTAVDVGAHVGLWSRPLSTRFGQVFSFEPMPEFRTLLALNSPKSNILSYALGDLESTVRMELPVDNSGMAHIIPDSEESGAIELRTLDSFDLQDVDFVKIDCEGYEYPILLGSIGTLLKFKPVVVVEQKPHVYFSKLWGQYDAIDFLRNRCSYRVADRVIDDWILVPI